MEFPKENTIRLTEHIFSESEIIIKKNTQKKKKWQCSPPKNQKTKNKNQGKLKPSYLSANFVIRPNKKKKKKNTKLLLIIP